MKKSITIILLIISLFCINIQNIFALENSDIYSNEAIIVNLKTDEVLFNKNTTDESVGIASLTKVMTYVIAIENINDLTTKIKVPIGTRQDIINQNASNAGLKDEYEYTALDLLYGLMLPSGCDAADVLAKYIANNDNNKFVDMMNDKAKELKMNNTIFYDASGLGDSINNNLSTEQDLYKLAKYAFNLPYFKEIIKTEFYEITGTKDNIVVTNTVRNTNYMMGEYNGAEYYYQYSLGGKTGNTSNAGRCLISFAKKGDLEIVAITLGVPNQHSNYHLTDHQKLFDYAFQEFSDNITVDIGTLYKAVGIGEKIQITPTTSDKTSIIWTSSDESVATVNEYGIVTGHKLGQAKIIATTQTGNQDYAYVSVGFYNGIDVKYSSGPSEPNGILGYGKLDWTIFKDYGIDFAIIRAGYALNNRPDSDPYFVTNIKGAIENNLNVMISFDGYATDESYALKEAEYLINYLNESIPEYLDKITLPIVYNLFNSKVSDASLLIDIMKVFNNKMMENGYNVIIELGKTKLSTMNLEQIKEENLGLYVIWRPILPDFKTQMKVANGETNYNANLWAYRTDAYFGSVGVNKKINMATMYMDYTSITTQHEKHDDTLYSPIPSLSVDEYVYNGENIEANVKGYDSNTMDIYGNVARDAGIYIITVKPKIKWQNGSKEEITLSWEIKKADPTINKPTLESEIGTRLGDIKLPENWSWKNENEIIADDKSNTYLAIYTPLDTQNYNTIETELLVEIKEETIINKVVTPTINNQKEEIKKDEPQKEIIYDIIKGQNLVYTLNNNDNLLLEIANLNSLAISDIYIDNIKLNAENYILELDNIIKIKNEYLDTLEEGKHTINIFFEDNGLATTEFNVVTNKVINTLEIDNSEKDNKTPLLMIIIISTITVITISIIVIITIKKRTRLIKDNKF